MELKLLGLNKFESEAYQTLVRIGKASASNISSLSGVPNSRIYDVLESLVNKGLVRVSPEKPKAYIATDPSYLKSLIEDREKNLKKLSREIDELEKSFKTNPAEVVTLSKGKIGFSKAVRSLPRAKNKAYSVKYTADLNPEWIRNFKESLRRGVKRKTLVRYDEETKDNIKKWSKIDKNQRPIENEGIAMSIVDDEAILIGMIKSETQLVIRDKSFVRLMTELIESYWKHTEKIK